MAVTFARLEYSTTGAPYELCGRTQLYRALSDLKQHFGLEMRLGIAFDFKLYRAVTEKIQHGTQEVTRPAIEPVESNMAANNSYSMMAVEDELLEVCHMLKQCGVAVEAVVKGKQLGQFRMVMNSQEEAMRATENCMLAKMTLKKYFLKKGIEVSFVPCEPDIIGSVQVPVSVSLWKDGKNVSGDEFSLF